MPSAARYDLAELVLDHEGLGARCTEWVRHACVELQAAGFELTLSSAAGLEPAPGGAQVLAYARLATRAVEPPLVVCMRMTCKATADFLSCVAAFELHRCEAPERPRADAPSLVKAWEVHRLEIWRLATDSDATFAQTVQDEWLRVLAERMSAERAQQFARYASEAVTP